MISKRHMTKEPMPNQTTLFGGQAKTRPDAEQGQKVVYEGEPEQDRDSDSDPDRTAEAVAAPARVRKDDHQRPKERAHGRDAAV
jgi:hypothetical protein